MDEARKKLRGLFKRNPHEKTPNDGRLGKKEHTQRQRRERSATSHSPLNRDRREHRHHAHSPEAKSEPRASTTSYASKHAHSDPEPLTEWPPADLNAKSSLSQGRAMELITPGAPVFKGHKYAIPHASEEYYRLYATCEGNGGAGSDCADPFVDPFAADSLPIFGPELALHPWETLEQPSMSFCYGLRPGEITLNHWVSLSGKLNPPIELRDPGIQPKEIELSTILDRLVYLEEGFEENYADLMYKNLYQILLRDPDKYTSPHKGMEQQIADLIVVLSRPEWIDFSKPENQVVAKYFANASYTDRGRYKAFFHQLLLSMELNLRIHSEQHTKFAKEKLLSQLPPCITWDLALARRWRECMSIEKYETAGDSDQIRFHLHSKKAQVKALRRFARAMKWPNLVQVDEVLKERDVDAVPLEEKSSDAMSYFTGMILPGATLPWLIINTLIDCDFDAGVNSLAALTHMHPFCGFQYKSTTYWSSSSIVGKVLAPSCREIGGWVGPARPAPDLGRTQIARIRQRKPKQKLAISDIESMRERSDPLGPPSDAYPVSEYELLLPELDPNTIVDTVRIEKLALKVTTLSANTSPRDKDQPLTYDAAVQFAIAGESWPLRLSYDVSFISACPCARGPHPLFFDYVYKCVKVDEILSIRHWGTVAGNGSSLERRGSGTQLPDEEETDPNEVEKILVIEAFGVPDNEILARAWCAHWDLSAVVADLEKTCMSCAIREAYAACLNVVILIEGSMNDAET